MGKPGTQLPVPPFDTRHELLELQQQLFGPHDVALHVQVTVAVTVQGWEGVQLPLPGFPPLQLTPLTVRTVQFPGQVNAGLD